MVFVFGCFKHKDKKTGGHDSVMLAERMRRIGAFTALLMFLFASLSTSQLVFLGLDSELDSTAFFSSSRMTDSDADGILDTDDACPNGNTGWTSNSTTDHDTDGCEDDGEDPDDDNDLVSDAFDDCSTGAVGWTSSLSSDYDADGCQDATEDAEDANDADTDALDG